MYEEKLKNERKPGTSSYKLMWAILHESQCNIHKERGNVKK